MKTPEAPSEWARIHSQGRDNFVFLSLEELSQGKTWHEWAGQGGGTTLQSCKVATDV